MHNKLYLFILEWKCKTMLIQHCTGGSSNTKHEYLAKSYLVVCNPVPVCLEARRNLPCAHSTVSVTETGIYNTILFLKRWFLFLKHSETMYRCHEIHLLKWTPVVSCTVNFHLITSYIRFFSGSCTVSVREV